MDGLKEVISAASPDLCLTVVAVTLPCLLRAGSVQETRYFRGPALPTQQSTLRTKEVMVVSDQQLRASASLRSTAYARASHKPELDAHKVLACSL